MSERRAARENNPPALPLWPVLLLFVGFPLWWALGLGVAAVPVCGVVMGVLLAMRGQIAFPRVFLLWILFVAWAVVAVLQVQGAGPMAGVAVRLSNYFGATMVFLYVANGGRGRLTRRAVVLALLGFFAVAVAGGWLGMLYPHGHLSTVAGHLLPDSLRNNQYVRTLVDPSFAEVQTPYGSPRTFVRPSAPFPYTNSWGVNVALLVPVAVAATYVLRGGRRLVPVALLLLACVPAFATLNRGLFLAAGVALTYGAVRLAIRGRLVPLAGVLLLGAVVLGAAASTGVLGNLNERLHYSDTNVGRSGIYSEAYHGTLASPWFGHGAPQPSQTLSVSVGTQGQVWNVMFSYGFPALLLFVCWFLGAAALTARGRRETLWLHVSLVVGALTIAYYGYDGPQLSVQMAVAGACLLPSAAPAVARRSEVVAVAPRVSVDAAAPA